MRESLERIGRFDPERARQRLADDFTPDCTPHVVLGGDRGRIRRCQTSSQRLNLEHLYLRPRHQGLGVGSLVLAIVFDEADRQGLPLPVGALRGSRSSRFYARHGFALVSESEWDLYYLRAPTLSAEDHAAEI